MYGFVGTPQVAQAVTLHYGHSHMHVAMTTLGVLRVVLHWEW